MGNVKARPERDAATNDTAATAARHSFTKARQVIFLNSLAATCNVRDSAKAAGVTTAAVYSKRRTDPLFAISWQQALETAYAALETLLLKRAQKILATSQPSNTKATAADMTIAQAISLFSDHRKGLTANGKERPVNAGRADEAETATAIMRKLDILRNRLDAGKA